MGPEERLPFELIGFVLLIAVLWKPVDRFATWVAYRKWREEK